MLRRSLLMDIWNGLPQHVTSATLLPVKRVLNLPVTLPASNLPENYR